MSTDNATIARAAATAGERNEKVMDEPISLAAFRKNVRSLTANWKGYEKPVQFAYKPGALDAEHYDKLREDEDLPISEWAVRYCARVLAAIPTFTEDDGSPLAITYENMRLVPTGLLNTMINAISEDLNPKEKTDSDSNGTS